MFDIGGFVDTESSIFLVWNKYSFTDETGHK